jgi:hypothetical protein
MFKSLWKTLSIESGKAKREFVLVKIKERNYSITRY